MGFVEKADVRKLLQDEALINEVVEKALEDPDVIDDIASDVADALSDELEDDPEFKRKIISVASKNSDFKRRIMKELVNDLD